jgi:hypothetical protein
LVNDAVEKILTSVHRAVNQMDDKAEVELMAASGGWRKFNAAPAPRLPVH